MDSEEAAYASAKDKHNKYMVYGKKNRYIEVFQCSGDDMNLVLNGGVHSPVNQRKSSPLLSHGMLQASQQQQQSQPQANATATQSLPSGLTLPQPLALSNLSITRPHASSANAALIAQQQAHLIAQQSLLARQQAAAAASVNHHQNEAHSQYFMPNFLIPASAANALHSANAVVQSSLMPQTNHHHAIHVSTANTAQLQTTQAFQSPLSHTTHPPFLYMQRTSNIPSATIQTGIPSTATIPFASGIPSNIQNIPFQTHPSIPFVNPYTNQVLLSPHSFSAAHNNSLAALHLRSPQHAQQTHHLQSNLNNQLSYANQYLQSTIPKPILASPNSYQLPNHLTVNTNAATATSLMHAASFKRSYESAFHHDPSNSLHNQKRPTPHLY